MGTKQLRGKRQVCFANIYVVVPHKNEGRILWRRPRADSVTPLPKIFSYCSIFLVSILVYHWHIKRLKRSIYTFKLFLNKLLMLWNFGIKCLFLYIILDCSNIIRSKLMYYFEFIICVGLCIYFLDCDC